MNIRQENSNNNVAVPVQGLREKENLTVNVGSDWEEMEERTTA